LEVGFFMVKSGVAGKPATPWKGFGPTVAAQAQAMAGADDPHVVGKFAPLVRQNGGYLPIEDHGLIGDGETAALVARDGTVCWLCLPRFDSPAVFCSLLDTTRGGAFRLAPEMIVEARQRYELDSGVLVTELRSSTGLVRITDALTLHRGADLTEDGSAARQELLRHVVVLDGQVRLVVDIAPRGGAQWRRRRGGWQLLMADRPDLELHVSASAELRGSRTEVPLKQGDQFSVVLHWGPYGRASSSDAPVLIEHTLTAWQQWMCGVDYEGPEPALVRRSAITLKLLDHFAGGAILAAPTSSLPETIGGHRNWDYRYTWVRDAAFSVYGLRRIGLHHDAQRFLGWVLDAVETAGQAQVLYDLDGRQPPPERDDPQLEGYRCSRPVRWGNGAANQRQHDAYGEILDCAYQWVAGGGSIDEPAWSRLVELIEEARTNWRTPDQGIWEVRCSGRPFTYSAAMCQVALDRGARMAERLGLPGDTAGWRAEADHIRDAILTQAWNPTINSITEHIDGTGGLDASVLALPLRRVLSPNHPHMVATTDAVMRRLDAGEGLVYRYHYDESPDGLAGQEGAFLLCSFWLVDNLAYQGRLDKAFELYHSLCSRAGPLGLLPEEIEPSTGSYLGNYPQAFSHVGVISSGINLARLSRRTS
jgi:alpha,alpha-trehalase